MMTASTPGVVAVVAIGLWSGGALIVAVERTRIWSSMSIEAFSRDFTHSIRLVDPMQPILAFVGTLACVVAAILAPGTTSSALWWAAGATAATALIASLVIAEPMNSKFRRLNGDAPPDAASLRRAWTRFHRARTVVCVGSLVLAAAALALG